MRWGLAQVDLLSENGERFPYIRFFNATNYKVPYPYRIPDTAADAVWGLQEDQVGRKFQPYLFWFACILFDLFDLFLSPFSSQVEWTPWVDIEGFRGFGRALTMSRTRCLIRDEYGALFYLSERVVRQHTPNL